MIPDNLQKSDLVTTQVQKRKFVEPEFANESSSDDSENHDDAKTDKACKRKFDELIFPRSHVRQSCRKLKSSFLSQRLQQRFSHLVSVVPVVGVERSAPSVQIST